MLNATEHSSGNISRATQTKFLTWAPVNDSSLVRKKISDEMLISHVGSTQSHYVAKGTIPSNHSHFGDVSQPHADISGYIELVIQATEVIAQCEIGLDCDTIFVLRDVNIEITPEIRKIERLNSEPLAMVSVSKQNIRTNSSGLSYAIDGPFYCSIEGKLAAIVHGTVATLTPATYAALRGVPNTRVLSPPKRSTPTAPVRVGRARPENVLIERLIINKKHATAYISPEQHPSYFDRPLDHYPGMMTAEAARQVAVALASDYWDVDAYQVRTYQSQLQFRSFAELDVPPLLNATISRYQKSEIEISVLARQGGRIVLHASFTFTLKYERINL